MNAGWAYNGNNSGGRFWWLQHSVLGRFGVRNLNSYFTDYFSNSLSCSITLLPTESFYCVALQASGINLNIGSVPSSYPTFITINLLN